MNNYPAAVEATRLIRGVEDINDAIDVAVSEASRRLNQKDKEYVKVEVGTVSCPACGEPSDSAFVVANTVLAGLLLEIKIFSADGEKHASRIAKGEVGGTLRDVPLDVIDIREFDSDEEQ